MTCKFPKIDFTFHMNGYSVKKPDVCWERFTVFNLASSVFGWRFKDLIYPSKQAFLQRNYFNSVKIFFASMAKGAVSPRANALVKASLLNPFCFSRL